MATNWGHIGQFGIGLLGNYLEGMAASKAGKAQRMLDEATARASNIVRAGRNERRAAVNALDNYTRSINNQRVMQQGGDTLNTMSLNFVRSMDQATKGNMQQQIAAAEQAGAAAAAGAAAGVNASSRELLQRMLRVKQTRIKQERELQEAQARFDFGVQQGRVAESMVRSIDMRFVEAGIDQNEDFAPYRPVASSSMNLLGALAKADWKMLAGAFGDVPQPAQGMQATGLPAFTTPAASPAFGDAVYDSFFKIN